MRHHLPSPAAMLACLSLTLCSLPGLAATDPADLVLVNGRVYTVTPDRPWAEALAVRDGRILAVGSNADIAALRSPATRSVDLEGRMVMPGLIDAHVHPAWGGVKQLYQCNFPFSATPADVAAAISACVKAQPESAWIVGGQWTSDFFVDNPMASPRRWLDEVSADKAVILTDDSGHNHWANTRALELMGVSRESEDPPGGHFGREADGAEPNGIIEEAPALVKGTIPAWTLEQYTQGAAYALKAANRYGITGMKDASASPVETEAFYRLDQSQGLTANVAAALFLESDGEVTPADIAEYQRLRETFASPHVLTGFVKLFLDGVPTASRTAAMLEPYEPLHAGDPPNRGSLHLQPAALTSAVTRLDQLGFTVKIHAAGDRAIRVALDAIAAARKANGDSGLRHELAHAESIADSDLPRFAALDVVADESPYIWFPSPITESIIGAVGEERGGHFWPIRSLLESGAPMLVGSDWPSAVPDMNPWTGMEALVTRRDPAGEYPGVQWGHQAISLEQAIGLFTVSGARALRIEEKAGSLEPGKSADFIVLADNLFDIPASAISDTRVLQTYFEGRLVYEDGAQAAP